jgi:hypothetical protein
MQRGDLSHVLSVSLPSGEEQVIDGSEQLMGRFGDDESGTGNIRGDAADFQDGGLRTLALKHFSNAALQGMFKFKTNQGTGQRDIFADAFKVTQIMSDQNVVAVLLEEQALSFGKGRNPADGQDRIADLCQSAPPRLLDANIAYSYLRSFHGSKEPFFQRVVGKPKRAKSKLARNRSDQADTFSSKANVNLEHRQECLCHTGRRKLTFEIFLPLTEICGASQNIQAQ